MEYCDLCFKWPEAGEALSRVALDPHQGAWLCVGCLKAITEHLIALGALTCRREKSEHTGKVVIRPAWKEE